MDISDGGDLSCIDGPLLVLVRDDSGDSGHAVAWFTKFIRRLSDKSEFWAAVTRPEHHPDLVADRLPAVVHLFAGRIVARCDGIDELREFVEDFVEGNRR